MSNHENFSPSTFARLTWLNISPNCDDEGLLPQNWSGQGTPDWMVSTYWQPGYVIQSFVDAGEMWMDGVDGRDQVMPCLNSVDTNVFSVNEIWAQFEIHTDPNGDLVKIEKSTLSISTSSNIIPRWEPTSVDWEQFLETFDHSSNIGHMQYVLLGDAESPVPLFEIPQESLDVWKQMDNDEHVPMYVIFNFENTYSDGRRRSERIFVKWLYHTCVLGDLNMDGEFNVQDIILLVSCVGLTNCGDLGFSCAADLNCDGGYNVLDIVSLALCTLEQNCDTDAGLCVPPGEDPV